MAKLTGKRRSRSESVKEYDKSSHSVHRAERDDLNSPGQTDTGKPGDAPQMSEAPGKAPKHRG